MKLLLMRNLKTLNLREKMQFNKMTNLYSKYWNKSNCNHQIYHWFLDQYFKVNWMMLSSSQSWEWICPWSLFLCLWYQHLLLSQPWWISSRVSCTSLCVSSGEPRELIPGTWQQRTPLPLWPGEPGPGARGTWLAGSSQSWSRWRARWHLENADSDHDPSVQTKHLNHA